jgi:hypothetical protein
VCLRSWKRMSHHRASALGVALAARHTNRTYRQTFVKAMSRRVTASSESSLTSNLGAVVVIGVGRGGVGSDNSAPAGA